MHCVLSVSSFFTDLVPAWNLESVKIGTSEQQIIFEWGGLVMHLLSLKAALNYHAYIAIWRHRYMYTKNPASEKARQSKAEAMQYHTVSLLEKRAISLNYLHLSFYCISFHVPVNVPSCSFQFSFVFILVSFQFSFPSWSFHVSFWKKDDKRVISEWRRTCSKIENNLRMKIMMSMYLSSFRPLLFFHLL